MVVSVWTTAANGPTVERATVSGASGQGRTHKAAGGKCRRRLYERLSWYSMQHYGVNCYRYCYLYCILSTKIKWIHVSLASTAYGTYIALAHYVNRRSQTELSRPARIMKSDFKGLFNSTR